MLYSEYVKNLMVVNSKDHAVEESVNEVEVNNFAEIKKAYINVIENIFKSYKALKGTMQDVKLVNVLTDEIKEQINWINNNIDQNLISYRIDTNYIKAYYSGYQIAYLSLGNKKLSYNAKTQEGFLIWNIIGKLTCYGSTPLCRNICYNNGKSFGNNLKTKIRNLVTSMLDIFESIMDNMIKLSPYRNTFVRIHEDGDFYNTEYFKKWVRIADNTNSSVVSITAYTKDFRILKVINDTNKNHKLYVKYSLMKDTNPKVIDYVIKHNIPVYTVIDNHTVEGYSMEELFSMISENQKCHCDCHNCKKCYDKAYHTLVCKAH